MDIPSLFMIPSAVSSGKVHSVFPNSTDADFDFNRDSSATRVNSQGLIETVGYFGSELVTNGTFDNNLNNWNLTLGGQTVEWENGKVRLISDGTFASLQQSITTVVGKVYRARVDIDVTSGNLALNVGGAQVFGNGKRTLELFFTATGTSTTFQLKRYSGAESSNGTFDNATFVEVQGDRARLNYEIEGGLVNTKPSLLLEPQSTNVIPYSEDFTQSNWINIGSPTITPFYGISPDGTLNSTRVQFASSSNSLYDAISHTIGDTASIYVKGVSGETIQFGAGANVAAGQLFTLNGEWQRIEFQSNGTSVFCIGTFQSATARNIEVFGAQLEQLSYATSYIPTNGSTQTRAAETCNGAGTSSIFESSEGILYCEIAALADDFAAYRFISLYDGTYDNICDIYYGDASNRISVRFRGGGGTVINMFFAISDIMLFNKVAISWKLNKFKFFINGVSRGLNTSGAAPVGLDRLDFHQTSGSNPFYGKIRDIRVYNTKEMTDSEVDILLTKITS